MVRGGALSINGNRVGFRDFGVVYSLDEIIDTFLDDTVELSSGVFCRESRIGVGAFITTLKLLSDISGVGMVQNGFRKRLSFRLLYMKGKEIFR